MKENRFEILVIGGGHAGYEAALAAARMGADTALLTLDGESIGRMSCNPAIGGIAKSHIVCEIDALGGEMARNTDYTGIQFRTLNTRKGPAVQAHRVQCDKNAFPARILEVIKRQGNLSVLPALATELLYRNGKLRGVRTAHGEEIFAKAVIVTPGTFLNGVMYVGKQTIPGGRWDEAAANELSASIKALGFRMERLKTGTPPRLHAESLDYARMEIQSGMDAPPPFLSREARRKWAMFHVEHGAKSQEEQERLFHVEHGGLIPWLPGSAQLPCWLTHTTEHTHEIIHDNLAKSALYGGSITGTGVRYCPSIEDKIVKFPTRNQHHVFIEPEGRHNVRIYPNGTSNSLPEAIQHRMIHSIPGMERAVFIRPGYGIEYDFVDPTQLRHTLETKTVENLYFAGQINGTTGYEEAGGQGLLAGINAVLKLRGENPLVLERSEAYIGVLIDDLVTKGTDEPYRMFTSRAEYRLLLRQANAEVRMLPHARRIGLLSDAVCDTIEREEEQINREVDRLTHTYENGKTLAVQMIHNRLSYTDLASAKALKDPNMALEIQTRINYAGYIDRELDRIARAEKSEKKRIPVDFDYDQIKALRFEAREKLKRIRPETLGQASRISGVNPPDITILSVWLKRSLGSHSFSGKRPG
jgi:tRNA uridine 5-carboxymethylaminomethyl modification enzyme